MGKKTDGEEDPDGWSKPIGEKRRGKKNTENADDFASLLPSSTRTGKAYQRSDVTKEDDQKVDLVRGLFRCTFEKKENTTQLSTGPIATFFWEAYLSIGIPLTKDDPVHPQMPNLPDL